MAQRFQQFHKSGIKQVRNTGKILRNLVVKEKATLDTKEEESVIVDKEVEEVEEEKSFHHKFNNGSTVTVTITGPTVPLPPPAKRDYQLYDSLIDELSSNIDDDKIGLAVIIAVTGEEGPSGSEKDVEKVTEVFADINFAVWPLVDRTSNELLKAIEVLLEYKEFPETFKTLVVYSCSHGFTSNGRGYISLQNENVISIEDGIINPLQPSNGDCQLGEMSRVFLFDCSLENHQILEGFDVLPSIKLKDGSTVSSHSNTIVACAAYSRGSTDKGGLWTTALCDNIKRHYRDTSVTGILEYTWDDVCHLSEGEKLDIVPYFTSFCGPVFLHGKNRHLDESSLATSVVSKAGYEKFQYSYAREVCDFEEADTELKKLLKHVANHLKSDAERDLNKGKVYTRYEIIKYYITGSIFRIRLIVDSGKHIDLCGTCKLSRSVYTTTTVTTTTATAVNQWKLYIHHPTKDIIYDMVVPSDNPKELVVSELKVHIEKLIGHSLDEYDIHSNGRLLLDHHTLEEGGVKHEHTIIISVDFPHETITRPEIDMCFLVDCTGSMSDSIQSVKDNIDKIVRELEETFTECDLQFGFVRYMDYDQPESTRTTWIDFTKSLGEFDNFVGDITAKGGKDTPEDVMGGLKAVFSKLKWRDSASKVLLHIADAPCHGEQYHSTSDNYPKGDPAGITHEEMMSEVARLNINYFFGYINSEATNKMVDVFNESLREQSSHRLMIRQFDALQADQIKDATFKSVTACVYAASAKLKK